MAEKLAHAVVEVGIVVIECLRDMVDLCREAHVEWFRDGSCGGKDLRVVAHRLWSYLSKRGVRWTKVREGGCYYMREMEQPGVMEYQLEKLCK